MTEKYPIEKIDKRWIITTPTTDDYEAPGGYQTKFWVNHPEFGKSLVKLEGNTAPAWVEKVVYEFAQVIGLPAAIYELAEYENNGAVITPDFQHIGNKYIDADTFNIDTGKNYSYTVKNALKLLDENNVRLPEKYQAPEGIETASDLFTGYLTEMSRNSPSVYTVGMDSD